MQVGKGISNQLRKQTFILMLSLPTILLPRTRNSMFSMPAFVAKTSNGEETFKDSHEVWPVFVYKCTQSKATPEGRGQVQHLDYVPIWFQLLLQPFQQ